MKTILTSTCITAIFTLGNLAKAQSTAIDDLLKDPAAQEKPQTTKMRIENLRSRHAESLATLTSALSKIIDNPATINSKSTYEVIDKGDRDMKRSQSACKSIISALNSELNTIQSDTAFSDEQKAELETAIKSMSEACINVQKEAEVVIRNLGKSYKAFPKLKKIYKSYLDIQGEAQAADQIKDVITEYINNLTVAPEEKPTEAEPEEAPVQKENPE